MLIKHNYKIYKEIFKNLIIIFFYKKIDKLVIYF